MRAESPLAATMWYKPDPKLAIIASNNTTMSARIISSDRRLPA